MKLNLIVIYMKILFVYPNDEKKQLFRDNDEHTRFHQITSKIRPLKEPPTLTFPLIAASTPKKHHIDIIEGEINDINFEDKYDLVGISSFTSTAFIAYEIADEFRKRDVSVVLGGWHPSALPDEAKQHADAVVIGEAEETWPQLLKDFEKGKLKPFYHQTRAVDPAIIPTPHNIYSKRAVSRVQATRGCPYGCEFCSIPSLRFGRIYRMRPIENVINEIKTIPNKNFGFHDHSLTINTKYTKKLFRQMKIEGINKKFFAMGNINTLGKDDELLKLASEAGCRCWFVGLESISQDTINKIRKTSNKVKEYPSSIKKIHDYGIYIQGSFIFGFDTDKKDIFDKTLDFVNNYDIDHVLFNILTPFPGTALFDRYEKEGRILTRDWSKYNMHNVVFKPKNMTPEYLQDNTKRISDIAYKYSNCIKRTIRSMKLGINTSLIVGYTNIKRRNDYKFTYKLHTDENI